MAMAPSPTSLPKPEWGAADGVLGHVSLITTAMAALIWSSVGMLSGTLARTFSAADTRPAIVLIAIPDQFNPISHLVFHNNGDGTFTDVSKKCGIGSSPGKGLGIAINDFDGDGWPDVFVANDSVAEQLFRNKHDGTFEEVALTSGLAYDQNGHVFAGMGADFGDYENSGWPSVFVNALANQKYKLFRNGKGKFDDVTDSLGLGASTISHSGWGAKWIDFDNDGRLDLFVAQGHVMDNIELTEPRLRYREPPLLLKNETTGFRNVSAHAGEVFSVPMAARGAAFGDLDNDGFIDVAINCNDGAALILHNLGNNQNHWLTLNLIGTAVIVMESDRRFVW